MGAAEPADAPGSKTPLKTIKDRRDFLAAARARKWATGGVVVQGRRRREGEPFGPADVRVGYTCSKKVGNAVARNRAKRRLRAAAAEAVQRLGLPGWDYVLIGKSGATIARPFAALITDVEEALTRIHQPKKRK